jgi:transketolase C-terminal domain/subunit
LDQVLASFRGGCGANAAKILVMHQHVLPVANVEIPKESGVSLTLDAADILTKAQQAGVKHVLRGHQHIPKVMRYSSLFRVGDHMSDLDGHDVCIVASGSTEASRIDAGGENTYSLVSVEEVP